MVLINVSSYYLFSPTKFSNYGPINEYTFINMKIYSQYFLLCIKKIQIKNLHNTFEMHVLELDLNICFSTDFTSGSLSDLKICPTSQRDVSTGATGAIAVAPKFSD